MIIASVFCLLASHTNSVWSSLLSAMGLHAARLERRILQKGLCIAPGCWESVCGKGGRRCAAHQCSHQPFGKSSLEFQSLKVLCWGRITDWRIYAGTLEVLPAEQWAWLKAFWQHACTNTTLDDIKTPFLWLFWGDGDRRWCDWSSPTVRTSARSSDKRLFLNMQS